jgi:hypothetical protein
VDGSKRRYITPGYHTPSSTRIDPAVESNGKMRRSSWHKSIILRETLSKIAPKLVLRCWSPTMDVRIVQHRRPVLTTRHRNPSSE